MTFTKLFSSITESSVWCQDDQTRLVWITMLAMADRLGRVWASVPGLANRARVSVESAEKAIKCFSSPDPYSRTKDHDGRRIEEIDGGWRLLNHAKYRAIRDEEAILESKRKYINTRRAVENVDRCRHNAEAYAASESNVHTWSADARAVLFILNEACGKHFRETDVNLKFIQARLSEPEVTVDEVRKMISRQTKLWKGTDMEKYLRPETLFNATKFQSYYADRESPIYAANQPSNQQRPNRNLGTANEDVDYEAYGRKVGEIPRAK